VSHQNTAGPSLKTMTIRALPSPSDRVRRRARPLWRQLAGDVLREHRLDAGLRLRDVAERAGMSTQYLSEVERGRKEPSSEMLESICGALGVDLLDLVRGVGRRLAVSGPARREPLRVGAADWWPQDGSVPGRAVTGGLDRPRGARLALETRRIAGDLTTTPVADRRVRAPIRAVPRPVIQLAA